MHGRNRLPYSASAAGLALVALLGASPGLAQVEGAPRLLGATAESDGAQPEHPASLATDGDLGTYWRPASEEAAALTLRLSSPARVEGLEIAWPPPEDRYWFEVHVSEDGSSFREVANQRSSGQLGFEFLPISSGPGVRAVRIYAFGGEAGAPAGIAEVNVIGWRDDGAPEESAPEEGLEELGPEEPAPTAPTAPDPQTLEQSQIPVAAVHASERRDGYPEENAVDGDRSTRWVAGAGESQIVLVLDGQHSVTGLQIDWDSTSGQSYDFVVQALNRADAFDPVAAFWASPESTGFQLFPFPGPVTTTEIQLRIAAIEGAAAINEIRVLGTGALLGPPGDTEDRPAPPPVGSTDPEDPLPSAPPLAGEVPSDDGISALRTLHVSPQGSDSGDGTAENPFRSLKGAAQILQPGDDLVVHGGTWTESVHLTTSGTEGNPIRILAREGAAFDVRGAGDVRSVFLVSASHLVIRGFDIRGPATAFELGDGLYPLADVCADLQAFYRGVPEEDRSQLPCPEGHPTTNLRVTDVIIDGQKPDGTRALLDLPTGPQGWTLGVGIFDEAENIVVRNYEMANMRHAIFSDGPEQVRYLVNLTLENLDVHDTRNYGFRIVARETYIKTRGESGDYRAWFPDGSVARVRLEENMRRHQTLRNVVIRNSRFHRNGFTDLSTGEAYGNGLIQGAQGGVVERSIFSDGPYWGIDALVCHDIIYRNNFFWVSESVRDFERVWPDAADPWPLVGLEVNGGRNNRVYNNAFWGFESGIFESMFPEDFLNPVLGLEVRNNLFWNNDSAISRFPGVNWLRDGSQVQPSHAMQIVPVDGFTVERVEAYNSMQSGVNIEIVEGNPRQFLFDDPLFFGLENRVSFPGGSPFLGGPSGNLRLEQGSRAVDSGQSLPAVPEGFDGTSRPQGPGYDRGAHEVSQ